jgi:hypothetical protein
MKRVHDTAKTANQEVQLEQKGKMPPHAVDSPIAEPWIQGILVPGMSMLSVKKVMRKASTVHSTHRTICVRSPVTGSTKTGVGRAIMRVMERIATI